MGVLLRGNRVWRADVPVDVTGRWGWPAVPAQVRQAAQLMAVRLYERGFTPLGMVTMDAGAAYISKTDADVMRLLSAFKTVKVH